MRRCRTGQWLLVPAFLMVGACAPGFRGAVQPDAELCRTGTVAFYVPEGELHQSLLARWCAGVGPAVYQPRRSAEADVARITEEAVDSALSALPVADSVLIVAWNNHVGGGALEQFVDDVRAGRLTSGDSVHHFVLLLQEVYRNSPDVPAVSPDMLYASGIDEAPAQGNRTDIADWAVRHPELSVFYAPSMRNGPQAGAEQREDRGSAIVTSLPLSEPSAYELPVTRQRRVVPAGVVSGRTSGGEPWHMHVASVHLENRPEGARNPERARFEQIEWLLDAVPDSGRAVLGGDMNTWMRGPDEVAIWRARQAYPDTPPIPGGPTYQQAGGVLRMYLDYLFFRLEDGRATGYRRLPDPYGSDHFPILAWVHLD
ncbi:MAG TPA: endonuclease/exonuclease/phosphatase family protein [Longimicrobiales bacterium]|nr:endonuclease/exonuclease/phosphatase family protein [Longimicrobiales bacterium]